MAVPCHMQGREDRERRTVPEMSREIREESPGQELSVEGHNYCQPKVGENERSQSG